MIKLGSFCVLAFWVFAQQTAGAGDIPFRVDWTINFQTLTSTVGVLLVIFKSYQGIVSRLDRLETKVEPVWAWWNSTHKSK